MTQLRIITKGGRGKLSLLLGIAIFAVILAGCLPAPLNAGVTLPSGQVATEGAGDEPTSAAVTDSPTDAPTSPPRPLPTATPLPTTTPTVTPTPQVSGPASFQRPIAEPGRRTVDPSYRFGSTQLGEREPHHGVELVNSYGTPVLAAAPGTVFYAGDDKNGGWGPKNYFWFYGNFVVLEHTSPEGVIYTLYGHLSEVSVITGQEVVAGQELGKVGYTGAATGSHLHFEVRTAAKDYNSTRNPELWLAPLFLDTGEQTGSLAGRIALENGALVKAEDIVVESMLDGSRYYLGTYADPAIAGQPPFNENFAIGDLPPGDYDVSFVAYGLQKAVVTIRPGEVTVIDFTLK